LFTALPIAVAFIGMFVSMFVYIGVHALPSRRPGSIALLIGLVASVYCIIAGVVLLSNWHDPFSGGLPVDSTGAVVRGGRRGGLILLAIRYWPYVLIATGGYVAYHMWRDLRDRARAYHP
jgi:hypothetical protein